MVFGASVNLNKNSLDGLTTEQERCLVSSILADEIANNIESFLVIQEVVADDEYSRKFKTKIEVEFL